MLTGKLFEYLAAGRPILSLGSGRESAIARVLGECGVGICAGTDEDIVSEVIGNLLSGARFSWYEPKAANISAYSRARQAELMLEVIRKHLNRPEAPEARGHLSVRRNGDQG